MFGFDQQSGCHRTTSENRLTLIPCCNFRYQLKTLYSDGTTHLIFEPLDFADRMYSVPRARGRTGAAITKLTALAPKPRVNLTRFHGVFVGVPHRPNNKYCNEVTPAKRGQGQAYQGNDDRAPE